MSYARGDESYRRRLEVHLAQLRRDGLVDVWSDRVVEAGSDWARDIQNRLATADIVILLVTPDFVASRHCFEKELPEAMRRHEEEGVRILPVHVKTVDTANLPFGKLQGLPADLRPIVAWRHADDAWSQVARRVREAAEEILRTRSELSWQRDRLGHELPGD
ncbi:toll/interleukin-1 receptor domain-containing protein [Actinophytocola sp.]|uniref:toll/interleukin-1 receptor domain-containing protein n=1 Tax=Actinophytocola sp. TaxID=1872138 RepID=UPI00389A0390